MLVCNCDKYILALLPNIIALQKIVLMMKKTNISTFHVAFNISQQYGYRQQKDHWHFDKALLCSAEFSSGAHEGSREL